MNGGNPGLILLGLLVLLLLVAAVTDLRARIIANSLNAAIALLAPAWWWACDMGLWPDIAVQVALATGVFGVFAFAFSRGWMGGGDVKLLTALALWLPLIEILRLLIVMSIAGGVLTIVVLIAERLRSGPASPEVPYGVAIAFAGLWVIGERYLYQFA